MSSLVHAVTDGPLAVAVLVSALVGLVGFLSPCVLPLVPGYLSFVAGISGSGERSRRRTMIGAVLFVIGFSAIFVSEGVLFGSFGASVRGATPVLQRVMGAVTVVLGVVFVGGIAPLQRQVKLIRRLPSPGLAGAPLLGATFGLAWGPCATPTVGAVISMSYDQPTAARGALLTFAYCLGLGIPFVVFASGVAWASNAVGFVRRHMSVVSRAGGAALIVIGVLLLTGEWNHWMDWLRGLAPAGGANL